MGTSPPVMEPPSDQLSPLSRRHRANVAAWPWLAVGHTSLSWGTAFNAALVTIGANWVQRATQAAQDSPVHQPSNIQLYSGRAVATLYRLDTGNRMVDRRRYYLEEFISVLRLQRKGFRATSVDSVTLIKLHSGGPNWYCREQRNPGLYLFVLWHRMWRIYVG